MRFAAVSTGVVSCVALQLLAQAFLVTVRPEDSTTPPPPPPDSTEQSDNSNSGSQTVLSVEEGPEADVRHKEFLMTKCCFTPPCRLEEQFDRWCGDSNASCRVFPSYQTCPTYKGCLPRWLTPSPGNASSQGTLPLSRVAQCLASFVHFAEPSSSGYSRLPLPKDVVPHLKPLQFLKKPVELGITDFPIAMSRTKHMCRRPCNSAWKCQGKRKRGSYALDPCWKNFYRTGKHYPVKRHKSRMAVWAPPVMDQISQLVGKKHGYDPKLHAAIRQSLDKKPSLVIDVGSNLGVVSLFATHMGHRVVAFDPTPWTRHKLHLSLWMNNLTNTVTVVPAGVGSKSAVAHLAMVPGNLGGNQIVRDKKKLDKITRNETGQGKPDQKGIIPVQIVTLDESLAEEKDIIFIKIDVEGNEIEVIRGALKTLEKHRPAMIIETCFWCQPEVLFTLLQKAHYVCGSEDKVVDRKLTPIAGHWKWDVLPVLQPKHRSQLRPNVICIYDKAAAALPFDTDLDHSPEMKTFLKQWHAYNVETD